MRSLGTTLLAVALAFTAATACASDPATKPGPEPEAKPEPIAKPEPEAGLELLAEVKDAFAIPGIGPVALVHVTRGTIAVGATLELVGVGPTRTVTVTRVDPQPPDFAVVLRGLGDAGLERGEVLAMPGTLAAHDHFIAEITLLATADGGRATQISSNYKPLVGIHGATFSATVILLTGIDRLLPGATGSAAIDLEKPIALTEGMTFDLREGGRVVGRGKVTSLVSLTP